MNATAPAWHGIGTLRDKVVLVACHHWTFAFEARYVRQVGLADMVAGATTVRDSCPAHHGFGRIGEDPCSLWDLGRLLGLESDDRSLIALERPGGLVAFRCGRILAVETIDTHDRHPLPSGLAPGRPGIFKSALALAERSDRAGVAWLFRASALLDRRELQLVQQDWQRAVAAT